MEVEEERGGGRAGRISDRNTEGGRQQQTEHGLVSQFNFTNISTLWVGFIQQSHITEGADVV